MLASVVLLVALVALTVWRAAEERRWRSPAYCIESPGRLWAGRAGPLPAGYTPLCPDSASYRTEVRRGETRVEQYRSSGWRPRELADRLAASGFRILEGELVNPGLYEAFLEGPDGGRLYYLASRQGGATVVTMNGPP